MKGNPKEPSSAQKEAEAGAPDPDARVVTGASATLSNVGPAHAGVPDAEAMDALEGTTSGRPVRGKPPQGSREAGDL